MCRRDANPWYLEQNTGDLDMEEIKREELKHLLKTMRIRVVSAVFIDGEKVLLAKDALVMIMRVHGSVRVEK